MSYEECNFSFQLLMFQIWYSHCKFHFCTCHFQNHSGSCGFEPIYCENKCGMKVQRRHLTQHKAAECSKRLVPCRYCSKEFVADTLQVHHTKCGSFPVACPNRCDVSILAREDLDLHLKDQCPILGMCCPFKDAGCRFKVSKAPLCIFVASYKEKIPMYTLNSRLDGP